MASEGKDTGDGGDDVCGFPSCSAEATKTCTGCRAAWYCSPEHQRSHWKAHKVECRRRGGKANGRKANGRKANGRKANGASSGGGASALAASASSISPQATASAVAGAAGELTIGEKAVNLQGLEFNLQRRRLDEAEQANTEVRYNEICAMMQDGVFNIRQPCGPREESVLSFALGGRDVAQDHYHDAKAVELALGLDGIEEIMASIVRFGTAKGTFLMAECINGRSRNVALLLADGRIDPNQVDVKGHACFYATCCFGWPRCLKLLLADGRADPNQVDPDGCTPLRAAVELSNDETCVELLLADPRLDPNIADSGFGGSTPLNTAAEFGNVRLLARLLADPRVDPNHAKFNGETSLIIVASKPNVTEQHIRCLEVLLADPRVDPNSTDNGGYTALNFAAEMGNDRCVEILLADPRVRPNLAAAMEGRTPLWNAAFTGYARCVELLLAHPQVDPNLESEGRRSPLHAAASGQEGREGREGRDEGRAQCVEILLADKRVNVCRKSMDGYTILIAAIGGLVGQVGAIGGNDPTRILVIILKSRRITDHTLKDSIAFLRNLMPTQRQIDTAEEGGEPLTSQMKTASLILPVLEAEAKGEFRWCAHCCKLTPDVDLHRCGGCKQVGYCDHNPASAALPGGETPCHAAHWKLHKQECARFKVEGEEVNKARDAAAGAAGGAAGGKGRGGGNRKKKGKKKMKGRRVCECGFEY